MPEAAVAALVSVQAHSVLVQSNGCCSLCLFARIKHQLVAAGQGLFFGFHSRIVAVRPAS